MLPQTLGYFRTVRFDYFNSAAIDEF